MPHDRANFDVANKITYGIYLKEIIKKIKYMTKVILEVS